MRKGTAFYLLVAVALATALVLPAEAMAANKTITVNKGVSGATIGMKDSNAAKKIGTVKKHGKDDSYEGQTVYYFFFGSKSGGKYAVEMYSNASHKVIGFVVNSKSYKTSKGIRVGSTVSTLKKKYPSLKKYGSYYRFNKNPDTYFYIQSGKVSQIQIWKS